MYTSFFGLKENPFNLTPDPRYLFLSTHHKEALDHLLYGIKERKGFITVIGGVGTGKTTLCRALLSHLDASTKSALIFNAFISDMELLKTINEEFGIEMDPWADTKKAYIDALNDFLLETFRQGGNAVLLIDEAQNLSHAVLEQIRMLSNLETEKEKLIQIVLVGQSELKDILAAPSLRQFNERIMVRYDLKPLDERDITGFVEHRLVVAGGHGNLRFSGSALKKIYAYSRGIPRRINAVCDRALLIAYTREKFIISKNIVRKAIGEISGAIPPERQGMPWSWKRFVSYAVVLLAIIMVARIDAWNYLAGVLDHFSGEQIAIATRLEDSTGVSSKTLQVEEQIALPNKDLQIKKSAPFFLDEKTSLAGLSDLFKIKVKSDTLEKPQTQLSLVSFEMAPEFYVMLKKPFRVKVEDPSLKYEATPRYLLIREVKEEGAVAVDAGGNEITVSRDFILNHWGKKLSWFYLQKERYTDLVKGMESPDVLQVQRILNSLGYLVEPTGFYRDTTSKAVVKFQRDFGLKPDGIVGPKTMALLFQMTQ
jgi:general secretion pathway protein A